MTSLPLPGDIASTSALLERLRPSSNARSSALFDSDWSQLLPRRWHDWPEATVPLLGKGLWESEGDAAISSRAFSDG